MEKKRTTTRGLGRGLVYTILILLAVSYLYPLFFMFVNSIKTQTEYMVNPFAIDLAGGHYDNYIKIIYNFNILRYFGNTLLVVAGKMALTFPLAVCASYAFAKLRFKGRNKLYLGIMIVMFIPFQVIMIPVYVLFAKVKLIDTFAGMILLGTAVGLPGTILLLTSNFRGIPGEMIEAGKIDGCGYFKTIWSIIVPMGLPAISICVIMTFIGSWNELLMPMLLLKNISKQLVMPALNNLVQRFNADIPFQLAGMLIATVPAIAVYLLLQKQIIMGVSMGSLK